MARPQVLVIGAGFGGLRVARGLRGEPVDVTVVDRNNFHTFQPLLYQVATAGLDAGDVSFPVRTILRRNASARFVLGSVTAVDLAARTVTVDGDRHLAYDFLVVAAGSVSTDFGITGVEANAFPLKTLHDSIALRAHLLSRFEDASAAIDTGAARPKLDIVVVGGGPTGVETAGGMRELVDHVLRRDFPELDLDDVSITLVEAADRVLTPFSAKSSAKAALTLTNRGVEIVTGVGVGAIEPGSVVLADGRKLEADTIVWAAGVTASPIARLLGVELTHAGRIKVGSDLSVPGHPEVFAIGDIAASPTSAGRPLPQVAQPAIQGGKYVADRILDVLADRKTKPFEYRDKGSMATIGRNAAITELPFGLKIYGRLGWIAWLGLHILYLIGFRNRAAVLLNWAWNYLTYDHSARILVDDERD